MSCGTSVLCNCSTQLYMCVLAKKHPKKTIPEEANSVILFVYN